jgi:cell division protein FtsI/penicillin-binding protein 2
MFSLGFESAMPASEWPQTYSLDRTAAGIGQALISVTPLHSLEVTKS